MLDFVWSFLCISICLFRYDDGFMILFTVIKLWGDIWEVMYTHPHYKMLYVLIRSDFDVYYMSSLYWEAIQCKTNSLQFQFVFMCVCCCVSAIGIILLFMYMYVEASIILF